jgi:hypothetical protein
MAHAAVPEPVAQLAVHLARFAARVHELDGHVRAPRLAHVSLHQLLPLLAHHVRDPGVAVTRQIHEIEPLVHGEEIDRPGAARLLAGAGQPVRAEEPVQKARFPDV